MNSRAAYLVLAGLAAAALAWHFSREPQSASEFRDSIPPPASPTADVSPQAAASASAANAPVSSDVPPTQRIAGSAAAPPFEVSASVHEFCGNTEWLACREVEAFLDEMAAEPRDAAWASDMESRIASAVTMGLQGHARIRALECRRARCAMEYAMPAEFADLQFEGDLSFGNALVPNTGVFLPELDSATGTFIVTVLTWRKSDAPD
jgi:hypothetical protein